MSRYFACLGQFFLKGPCIFVTVLLVEILNFILNETTRTVTLTCFNDFPICLIGLNSRQNITHKYPGQDVNHSIHTCKGSLSYFILLFVPKYIDKGVTKFYQLKEVVLDKNFGQNFVS